MDVLVFDHCLEATGHRVPYACEVAKAFSEIGLQVTASFPENAPLTSILDEYLPPETQVQRDFHLPGLRHASSWAHFRRGSEALTQAIQDTQPERIIIPTADGLATLLSLQNAFSLRKPLRGRDLEILIVRGTSHYDHIPFRRRLKSRANWTAVQHGPWNRVLHLDHFVWQKVARQKSRMAHDLCPDPVPVPYTLDKATARRDLQLPVEGRIISALGNQNTRKGTDLMLRAFARAKLGRHDRLLLVGPVDDDVRQVIDSALQQKSLANRILFVDRFVSETEMQAAIVASDVVGVPYRSTSGPSGIVCRAIAWNRPILATNSGWLKWSCEHLQAGWTVDPHDTDSFAQRITNTLENADSYQMSEAARAFADFNTKLNFRRVWRKRVMQRIGKPETIVEFPTITNSHTHHHPTPAEI